MRVYLAAAIAVTILAAFAAKLLVFGTPPVVADTQAARASVTLDILQLQIEHRRDKLPVQEVKDPF